MAGSYRRERIRERRSVAVVRRGAGPRVTTIAVQELPVNPLALLGEQKPDEVGGVLRCSETPGRLLSDPADPDLIGHPAGVDRSWVDDVGSNARLGEFMGRCEHQPIEASLVTP